MTTESDKSCPDCDEAAKLAYSDATTPGFFYPRCRKHRESAPAAISEFDYCFDWFCTIVRESEKRK